MLALLEDYKNLTSNNLVNAEKCIINTYKNSGLSMAEFREAMEDLLNNEFKKSSCFEYSRQIEAREFEKCKITCAEDGTFTLEILEQLINRDFKSQFVKVGSFKELLEKIKSGQLLVSDIRNKDFLTFKQLKEVVSFWDMEKDF